MDVELLIKMFSIENRIEKIMQVPQQIICSNIINRISIFNILFRFRQEILLYLLLYHRELKVRITIIKMYDALRTSGE